MQSQKPIKKSTKEKFNISKNWKINLLSCCARTRESAGNFSNIDKKKKRERLASKRKQKRISNIYQHNYKGFCKLSKIVKIK